MKTTLRSTETGERCIRRNPRLSNRWLSWHQKNGGSNEKPILLEGLGPLRGELTHMMLKVNVRLSNTKKTPWSMLHWY